MIIGADVNAVVTPEMIQAAQTQTGKTIEFWGRYFKEAGNSSPEQYQPADEASLFHQRSIRVLPIARQTSHVSGSETLGKTDGSTNAEAIIDAFGKQTLADLPSGLLVFLDVEGPPHASMSSAYYKGWSGGIIEKAKAEGVTLLPGVYGAEGDSPTWTQLAQAVANGASCAGTWIARPGTIGCHPLKPFDEQHVRPPGLPAMIRVLIWQCVQECHHLDFNMLNPAFETKTLTQLVLPNLSADT